VVEEIKNLDPVQAERARKKILIKNLYNNYTKG
jgi:hypothetical protein